MVKFAKPRLARRRGLLWFGMLKDISNAILTGFTIIVLGVAMEVPNMYRALFPGLFGLEEIAPRIYTDAPDKAVMLTQMVRKAEENAGRFFDKTPAQPTYILCTKPSCEALFGALPEGLTMGFHRVIIAPSGMHQMVFNHERIHVDLHYLMGMNGLTQQRFPAWFDEGLSEYLAGPVRLGYRPKRADKRAVLKAESFTQWNALVRDGQYNRHYGAARQLVADIVHKIGRAKLREIVLESKSRAEFMARLPQSVLNQ